jgi:Phosphotransferase enzyme family
MSASTFQHRAYDEPTRRLLQEAGLAPLLSLTPVKGGGNNRVLLVQTTNGETALLKSYFLSEHDPRDRFLHEQAFYNLAGELGIKNVPQMWGSDEVERLALFEFVEGNKLSGNEILHSQVTACSTFFMSLNQGRTLPLAVPVPIASEACFSLGDHFALIQRRVDRLKDAVNRDLVVDREVADWITDELVTAWTHIGNSVLEKENPEKQLIESQRCFSPSDFGFHNAIQSPRGLLFFDFEYAGWDDPAKMACDFFCQPEVPVPISTLSSFLKNTCLPEWDPEVYEKRVNFLLPAYRIKWACIILNVFLSAEARRRNFADEELTTESARKKQLAKARLQLAQL